MTKNCHKVVMKYLTRNVKFMNIIPGCNTKVGGQKLVNKNCLMLCKWPEEASVRVWPNMSLQRALAGAQLGCLYFLYLNVSLVQWIRRNIHGISNKNCWQIFICLVELSSILHDSNAMLHLCTRSALLKSFFVRIKVSGPKPERSIPMFVTRVDYTMSTLSCLNMRIVIDGVEFYLARVYSLPAQTSFS